MNTMRYFLLSTLLILAFSHFTVAQVAINADGSTPDPTAMLDISSTEKGILIPRMTTSERTIITTPATGLLVYDTDTGSFWYYENSQWQEISTSAGAFITSDDLTRSINHTDDFVFGADNLDINSAINGNEVKFFFDKSSAAFRAGSINTDDWNQDSLGFASVAMGENPKASGLNAVALGFETHAGGTTSTALGSQAVASGTSSVAMGEESLAEGAFSLAAGAEGQALGNYSSAIGLGNIAAANHSTAIGTANIASGEYATTLGRFNQASGSSATAFGYQCAASGIYSTAFGTRNEAFSFGETSLGIFSTRYNPSSATAIHASDRLLVVGNGTSELNRSDALRIYKNGNMELNGAFTINNAFTFPTTDGNAGQVLSTNGSGGVAWTSIPIDDDQGVDRFQLTNTSLRLSLENDGENDYTVDLAPLKDNLGNHNATQNLNLAGNSVTNGGTINAANFVGDGSALTNVPTDNLGNHTATQNLNLANNNITNAGTVNAATFIGDGSALTNVPTDNLGNHTATQSLNLASNNITNAGTVNAANFVGDGSALTNVPGDDLGNHTATQNIRLSDQWLSNDGDNEGIRVQDDGDVQLGGDLIVGATNSINFSGNITAISFIDFALPNFDIFMAAPLLLDGGIKLNGTWISNDGGNEGLSINNDGIINTSSNLGVGGHITAQNYLGIGDNGQNLTLIADKPNNRIILDVGGSGHSGDAIILGEVGTGSRNPVAMLGNLGVGTFSVPQKLTVGVQGDGTKAVANDWDTWSDQRLKRDFVELSDPLEKLQAINGYYYYWTEDKADQTRQVGVIAQEIEAVLPELVTNNPDSYKSVDYSKLVALLIEVNQAQQAEIEALQTQVARIDQLEAMLQQLQDQNLAPAPSSISSNN